MELLLLRIPDKIFYPPQDYFYIRSDNGKVQLKISRVIGSNYLKDRPGVDFNSFVIVRKRVPAGLQEINEINPKGYKSKRRSSLNVVSVPSPGQFIIKHGDTGISYNQLFGKYLKGAKTITI